MPPIKNVQSYPQVDRTATEKATSDPALSFRSDGATRGSRDSQQADRAWTPTSARTIAHKANKGACANRIKRDHLAGLPGKIKRQPGKLGKGCGCSVPPALGLMLSDLKSKARDIVGDEAAVLRQLAPYWDGALPRDNRFQALRKGLERLERVTPLVQRAGDLWCIKIGEYGRIVDPDDPRLAALGEGHTGDRDTADRFGSENGVRDRDTRASGTTNWLAPSESRSKERGCARARLGPEVMLFSSSITKSAWLRCCSSATRGKTEVWDGRAAQLFRQLIEASNGDEVRGSSRDVARTLYDLDRASPSPLIPLHLATSTGRSSALRGLERAIERFVRDCLVLCDRGAWRLPRMHVHRELGRRQIPEAPTAKPPSATMLDSLRRRGIEQPEQLSAPEALALHRRLHTERQQQRAHLRGHAAHTAPSPPRLGQSKPRDCGHARARPEHCQGTHEIVVFAHERGIDIGTQPQVDALDAALRERDAAIPEEHRAGVWLMSEGGELLRWAVEHEWGPKVRSSLAGLVTSIVRGHTAAAPLKRDQDAPQPTASTPASTRAA